MDSAANDDRLDRLESAAEITRLVHEFCNAADRRDPHRFAAIWHDDATWTFPSSSLTGVDAIVRAMREQWDHRAQVHHWSANLVVTVDGDTATGESEAFVAVRFPDGGSAWINRTYSDQYERRDGAWRIAARTASEGRPIDGPGDSFGA